MHFGILGPEFRLCIGADDGVLSEATELLGTARSERDAAEARIAI